MAKPTEPCFICFEECRDPVAGPCQHATCRHCAESWLSHKEECAYCRQPLKLEEVLPCGDPASPDAAEVRERAKSDSSPTSLLGCRSRRLACKLDLSHTQSSPIMPSGASPRSLTARDVHPQRAATYPRQSEALSPFHQPFSPTGGSLPRRLASMIDLNHAAARGSSPLETAQQAHAPVDVANRHSPAGSPSLSQPRALALSPKAAPFQGGTAFWPESVRAVPATSPKMSPLHLEHLAPIPRSTSLEVSMPSPSSPPYSPGRLSSSDSLSPTPVHRWTNSTPIHRVEARKPARQALPVQGGHPVVRIQTDPCHSIA